MNRSSKTSGGPGQPKATPFEDILNDAMVQGKGATFGQYKLKEIVEYSGQLLLFAEENVDDNEDHSEMAKLLERSSRASAGGLDFTLKPHEVCTWLNFFELTGKVKEGGPTVEKQVLEWMRHTPTSDQHHPLDFRRDPKRDYAQGLYYQSGYFPNLACALSESRCKGVAEPYFFHMVSTVEKLKACAKQRTNIQLSHSDMCAVSILLFDFLKSNHCSSDAPRVYNNSFMDATRRIESAVESGKSLTIPRLELRAISIIFDHITLPKPFNDKTKALPSASSSGTEKENKSESIQDHDSKKPPHLSATSTSKAMKKRILNFQTKAKQGREITLDRKAAIEINSVCRSIFMQGVGLVDWTEDLLHPQVKALRKLIQAMDPEEKQRVTLDEKEASSISSLFGEIPQHLKDFIDGVQASKIGTQLPGSDVAVVTQQAKPWKARSDPEDYFAARMQLYDDLQTGHLPTLDSEISELMHAILKKVLSMLKTREDDIDKDLLLLPSSSHPLLCGLALVENGIGNSTRSSQKALEESETSMKKYVSTSEANALTMLSKLEESTRSADEAYSKLKSESDQKISRLENELRTTKSNAEKSKTASSKHQGSLESKLSTAKKEAIKWEKKFNTEAESKRLLRQDYDTLSQKHETLTTRSQNLSTEQHTKIATQEKELAVLRSRRVNPAIERDAIARAVANALAIKQIELDAKQRVLDTQQIELEAKQQELDATKALVVHQVDLDAKQRELVIKESGLESERIRLQGVQEEHDEALKARNVQIADLKESLAVMENLSAESRGVSGSSNLF
ncbi:hypothetical protein VTL71DRAFT_10527 [Oculimacula yallundae]|uniref:Uncharacterized protein n=1 Tax=Oculimacula yallundae TaxID=86028 RepID=A0ABR4CT92_9HELO